MSPLRAPAAATAPAPAAATSAALCWSMPLPPPPHVLPAGNPRVSHPSLLLSQQQSKSSSAPDLVSPPPPMPRSPAASVQEFVPKTLPEQLAWVPRAQGSRPLPTAFNSAFNALQNVVTPGPGFNAQRGIDSTFNAKPSYAAVTRPASACCLQDSPVLSHHSEDGWRAPVPTTPSSHPAVIHSSAGREEDGWVRVPSRHAPRRPAFPLPAFKPRPPPPEWLKGRCFRCLAKGHRAAVCRDPLKCTSCLRIGHRAKECPALRLSPQPRRQQQAQAPPPPPGEARAPLRPAQLQLQGLPSSAAAPVTMPRLGDAASRPAEDHVIISATPEMQQEAALLSTNAAVAWLNGAREDVSTAAVVEAFATTFGARPADISVVRHYPEQFFVRFIHQHHCTDAIARRDFPFRDFHVQVRPWRLEANADNVDMLHHVQLCLEGTPLHAWNDHVVSKVIGKACSLDYIENRSRNKTDTRTLGLWAWTENPSAIPKVKWITLPARGQRARGRRGLRHRVLIHLAIVEDYSGSGDGPPPPPHEFQWEYGVIDGQGRRRDYREPPRRGDDRRDRHDDHCRDRRDDGNGGRRGRDDTRGQGGWRERLQRSLSRAPRDRSRDQVDGRRHQAAPPTLLLGLGSMGPASASSRGRSPLRSRSPGTSRRRSAAARTPPVSPVAPSSPTSVLPMTSPEPKGRSETSMMLPSAGNLFQVQLSGAAECSEGLQRAIRILTPPRLIPLLPSSGGTPKYPPGFENECIDSTPAATTPSAATPPLVPTEPTTPTNRVSLFVPAPAALLESPAAGSSRPLPPANRRKTFAGGFTVRRSSIRIKSKHRETPIAKMAEKNLCRRLGIIGKEEQVTDQAIESFVKLFQQQLPSTAIAALRALFRLDCVHAEAVEEALIRHGGQAAMEASSA